MSDTGDLLPTYEVAEWKGRDIPPHPLDPQDRRLMTSLGGDGPNARVAIAEMKQGLRVTARSWVGVVRFSSFEVRVVPKLVGGDLGLVRLIEYTAGLDSLDRHPAVRTFEEGGGSLLDLLALLLAEACEIVVRAGLRADYREVEDDLPVVRGRLLADRQVLRRFGRIDHLECRFDEHTTDTADNQLLLAALSACATRVRHPGVSVRVRRLLAIFGEACSLEGLDLRAVRTGLTYDRMNHNYRDGHVLAWLVLDGLGINDLFARGGKHCFAFLIDMNALFEAFVTRWLTRLLWGHDYRVIAQRQDQTVVWDAAAGCPYTHVRPDLMVEHKERPGQYLPVDAKYKLYDEKGVPPDDVYQSFVYAMAYRSRDGVPLPTSLLLYPSASRATPGVRLHVRRSGGPAQAQLVAFGFHMPTSLAEAEAGNVGPISAELLCRIDQSLRGDGREDRS